MSGTTYSAASLLQNVIGALPVTRCCGGRDHLWRSVVTRYVHRDAGVMLIDADGRQHWFCSVECMRSKLLAELRQVRLAKKAARQHRVPIGLLLISRGMLDERAAKDILDHQREAGHGRFGWWAQKLGYVSEREVTTAVAAQWGCPTINALEAYPGQGAAIPFVIMTSLNMVPVHFVARTRTLHVAFSEGVDYSALTGLERMLDCKALPCIGSDSLLSSTLGSMRQGSSESDVLFERDLQLDEVGRIVCEYAAQTRAFELRYAMCGEYLWARLHGPSCVNLLFRRKALRSGTGIM